MSDQTSTHDPQPGDGTDRTDATPPTAPTDKLSPERVGEAALKFATDTAYAAAGVANLLAEKAKVFYEQQKKQLAEKTPEGVDPNFRQFVDSMPDQFKVFIDEATKAYHDLAERGRHALENLQTQAQSAFTERPAKPESPEAFDLKEGAQATDEAAGAVAPEDAEAPLTEPTAEADKPAEENPADENKDA